MSLAETYRATTAAMLDALEVERFDDRTWVRQLLELFAETSFGAVEVHAVDPEHWPFGLETGVRSLSRSPPPRRARAVPRHQCPHQLRPSLLRRRGSWATGQTSTSASGRPVTMTTKESFIRATNDSVHDQVVAPVAREMHRLDIGLGPLDEWVTSKITTSWRADTWPDAIGLIETSPLGQSSIEDRALETARWIRHVGPD